MKFSLSITAIWMSATTHSQPILWELQQEYLTQVVTWLEETVSDVERELPQNGRARRPKPVLRWIDGRRSL